VVADDDGRADVDRPFGRGEPSGHDLEQGRLARAVGADDAEPLVAREAQLEAAEQPRAVAPAVADAVQVDDLVAQAGAAHREVERAGPRRGVGAALDDRRGRRDAGPGLAGPCGRAPP
jgi:hypothetical protein